MIRNYPPLPLHRLPPGVRFATPEAHRQRVDMRSPALAVMTDLRLVPAATIDMQAPIDAANRFMIRRGVRLLLVTDDDRRVLGLITATDILGEKPLKYSVDAGVRRQEVKVGDIMQPSDALEALSYDDVSRAEVGHVVASLQQAGRQHALVHERDAAGHTVRGIFSLSQIAAQLGVSLQAAEIAHTFAEIETALSH
jgi:CBS domain-containing protein